MSLLKRMKTILVLASVSLLVCPVSRIWAANTVYTFSESFDLTTHKGAGTTADWNTTNGVLQLPANSDPTSNTKQINGSVTVMGSYLYYAWIDFRGGIGNNNGHIYFRRYDQDGTNPTSEVQVDSVYSGSYISDSFFATYVKTINDGTYVYVFWVMDNNLYLQKFNAAGSRQWNSGDLQVNASAGAVTSYNYGYVTGLVNSDGTLSFFWNSGSGVYMQKLDPSGAGVRIGDSVRLLGSTDAPAYVDLSVASRDGSDNYYLIYSSYNYANSKKELFLDKFNSSGIEAWSGNRVTIASASSIYGADIATDASGNSYIVWSQRDSAYMTGQDVYITAVANDRSTIGGWTAKKVYTDTLYYNQGNPKVRLDSTNAPNVIWEDNRTTGKLDLYAQRFNTSGTVQWAADGVKVNIGDNPSANALYYTGYYPNFEIDSVDNSLYITWYAYRSSDFDVFGQKVTSAGANNASDWTITQVEAGGGYASSAVAFSDNVLYSNSTPILSARVYSSSYASGQTISLYLSNNGATYESVTSGATHTFGTSGTGLYWKAELSSTNPFITPVIYSLLIEYTVEGHGSPYHKILYIYDDSWHYQPTGWMAHNNRTDAMQMVSNSPDSPAVGSACVKITYDPNRAAWAGFYVQASGKWRANGGTGIDMSNYSAMIIKARAADTNANAIQVQFGVGGDSGDTVNVKTSWMTLTTEWQTFAIDLSNQDLTDVNGLVLVNMRRIVNIDPVIYIDDIQFIGPGPAVITDLKALLGGTSGSVNLTWTAPEGDYTNTSYIVKYSANYIANQIDFSSATTYSQAWTPGTPGAAESHTLTGLTPGQGYYFAVATRDEQGNQSDMSNVYYCIARSSGIGILVEGDVIDLGNMAAGAIKTGGPITVTNIGGVPMTTSLSVTNPPGWTADSNNTARNHYVLLAAFGSSEGAIFWTVATQVLSTTAVKSTATRFAGDQTGENIPVDGIRKLYIRFTAPLTLDIGTTRQEMMVNVTTGAVD